MKNKLIELAKQKVREEKRKAKEAKRRNREELLMAKKALMQQQKEAEKAKIAKMKQEQKELTKKILGIADIFIDAYIDAYKHETEASSDLGKAKEANITIARDGNFVGKIEANGETYYCQSHQRRGNTYLNIYNSAKTAIWDGDSHFPDYTSGYYIKPYEARVTQKGAKNLVSKESFYSLNSDWEETKEYKEFRKAVVDVVEANQKTNNNSKR